VLSRSGLALHVISTYSPCLAANPDRIDDDAALHPPRLLEHDPGSFHPESPSTACAPCSPRSSGGVRRARAARAPRGDLADIARVHPMGLIGARVGGVAGGCCRQKRPCRDRTDDTVLSRARARRADAVGAVCGAVDAVRRARAITRSGGAEARPPRPSRAPMGSASSQTSRSAAQRARQGLRARSAPPSSISTSTRQTARRRCSKTTRAFMPDP